MTCEWGEWSDPITEQFLSEYQEAGFKITTPEEHQSKPENLGRVALDYANLLQKVYGPEYPIDPEKLHHSMAEGIILPFTLHTPDDHLVAMSSFRKRDNPFDGEVNRTDFRRGVKDPDIKEIRARPLLRMRGPWAAKNLADQDILYALIRSAEAHDGTKSGGAAQRVWWGSYKESRTPLVTTTAGYRYKLGHDAPRPEPFNGFIMPIHPEDWANKVNDFTLHVPTAGSKNIIETLLSDITNSRVSPDININSSNRQDLSTVEFTMLRAATDLSRGQYTVTDRNEGSKATYSNIEQEFEDGAFSQEVIIESDIASTTRCAGIMDAFYKKGWSLVGWQPSYLTSGGICPVMSRVNPSSVNELVPVLLDDRNFVGLKDTQNTLKGIYETLIANASSVNN